MWEMIIKGGPLMFVILACSVIAFAVLIERIVYLRRSKIDTEQFMEDISETIKRNRIMDAIDKCNAIQVPVSRILKAGILKHDRPRTEIKEAIEDAGIHEIPQLERNIGILATIAHITPLLGLLGTVVGMVNAFQIIEQKATALMPVNPGDLAGGIWVALITTVAGLSVAIPTYVAYNFLVSKADMQVLEMEKRATELINLLVKKRQEDEI